MDEKLKTHIHKRIGAYLNTMVSDLGIQGRGDYLRVLFAGLEKELEVAIAQAPGVMVEQVKATAKEHMHAGDYSRFEKALAVALNTSTVQSVNDPLHRTFAGQPAQPLYFADEHGTWDISKIPPVMVYPHRPRIDSKDSAAKASLRLTDAWQQAFALVCERTQWNPETPSKYVLEWADAVAQLVLDCAPGLYAPLAGDDRRSR